MEKRLILFTIIAFLILGLKPQDTKFTVGNITLEDVSGRLVVNAGLQVDSFKVDDGSNIPGLLTATGTLDFGELTFETPTSLTFTCTGAHTDDAVFIGPTRTALHGQADIMYQAYVSSTNTITVVAMLVGSSQGGSYDPGSAEFRILILK